MIAESFKDNGYIYVTLHAGGLDTNLQPGVKKDTSESSTVKTFTGAISSIQRHDDSWLGTEVMKDVVFEILTRNELLHILSV